MRLKRWPLWLFYFYCALMANVNQYREKWEAVTPYRAAAVVLFALALASPGKDKSE